MHLEGKFLKTDNNEPSNVQYLPNIDKRRERTQANQQREASQHLTLDSEAYRALTNLIQQLVDQLSTIIRENPAFNDSQQKDIIKGTSGNDNFKGTRNDDVLRGGRGNDRLNGKAGDDKLFGGQGRDVLISISGSDELDGGRGQDTARIRGGNIDDYSIHVDNTTQQLSLQHKTTHDTIKLSNIERFKFNDVTVSEIELRKIATKPVTPTPTPTPTPDPILSLDPEVRDAIQQRFSLFGSQNFDVIDKDRNGQLSAGDIVSVTGGITGGPVTEITLTPTDIKVLTGGTDNSDLRAEFETNKQKWQNSRPDNYSYTVERSGFLGPEARKPIDVTVNGNTITNSQFSDGSADPVPNFNQLTLDDLFNTVENAINSGAAEVRVEYDPQFGYPTSIFIDHDRRIADEEVFLSASNLQNLDNPLISPPAIDGTDGQTISGGGVNIGGANISDNKIVDISGQQYSVGFLKTQLDAFADSFNPDIVDAAFGIYPWGTSNSLAAGTAFQAFISTNFPNGAPS